MTDVVILLGASGRVELRLGPESGLMREHLGMTPWVALEALVLAATPDGRGRVVVATSARDLAAKLGIGKDRAAAALAVLRDAGLLVPVVSNASRSGRFAANRYEIHIPVSRAADTVRPRDRDGQQSPTRRALRDGARLFETES